MTVDQATIDEVRTIVDIFSALTWPAPKAEIYPVAESLGWTLRSDREKGVDCIASFSFGRSLATIALLRGMISEISVAVSSRTDEADEGDRRSLALAYSDTRSVVEGILGEPSRVHRGTFPKTSWDLASGGRLAVARVKREVLLIVIHEEFADVERFEEARGIPGDRGPLADIP
ncbi:DUF6301 family protein [Microbacterium sp. RU33B]|uniref:DUF6301 family protein n=1 Tax=Microbacterium sp. RU33B TaxID=1907390 RepID=UPI00095D9385|nr:DUF6301 family protein [Microbacterium sp. RU33B]SIT89023.1 hypothetical protein SAMN05880545_3111 [Microbacterium sp. RU33B]